MATLDRMGHAALNEQRFADAAELLERSLARGGTATLLTRCRLASAYDGAGDADKAREHATRAAELLDAAERVSPDDGPEIHFRLANLASDEWARTEYLTTAKRLVEQRARTISNGGYREHFLTRSGPNPAIIEATRRDDADA